MFISPGLNIGRRRSEDVQKLSRFYYTYLGNALLAVYTWYPSRVFHNNLLINKKTQITTIRERKAKTKTQINIYTQSQWINSLIKHLDLDICRANNSIHHKSSINTYNVVRIGDISSRLNVVYSIRILKVYSQSNN